MAEHLVSIYGTEKDKINCPFYYKIGACRHGDRCSRVHNKPLFSQTILLQNLYQTPDQIMQSARQQNLPAPQIPDDDIRYHFEDFYEDVYDEMRKHGTVEAMYVCENLADHLAGNTYVKFRDEQSAAAALQALRDRWYAGRPVHAEYSPVTDFREGKCRPFERDGECERGDYCHFMHLRRHGPASPGRGDDRIREPSPDAYRQRSLRGYERRREHRHDARYGRYEDRRRDRRDGYDRERSREYRYGSERQRDRYGDYDRSYRSSRDRRSSYEGK